MQIDAVGTDADAVLEMLRSVDACARRDADMLLQYREFGADAVAFAEIGLLGEAVFGAEHVAAEPQTGIAVAAGMRRLGLQPIEEGEREAACLVERGARGRLGYAHRGLQPVIHLRPVRDGDIAGVS